MSRFHHTLSGCCIAALLTAVLLTPAKVATAARFWKNSVPSPGSWGNGFNWSASSAIGADNAGRPVSNDTVNVSPTDGANHTVTYDVGSPLTLTQLNVDLTGAGATTTTFSMSMSTNNLTSSNEWIGYNGRGTFDQSGGTNTIAAGSGFLDVGVFGGSKGTYNLSGTGSLVVNTIEYVGDVGTGIFNQTGGTNSIFGPTPNLYLGYNAVGTGGTYNLSGGALSTIEGLEAVGYKSVGAFNQSGGTNDANYLNVAQNATGTYTLSGGTLSVIHYENIGLAAAGTFNHTGGTNNAGYELDLGGGVASSSGTYSLSGTGILSAGTEYIGRVGAGTFTQTAGTNSTEILELDNGTYTLSGTGALTVTWQLLISNQTGNNSFNLNGGTINAAALDFSGLPARFHWTSGTLNVTQNVVWDPAGSDSTSVVFGSLLTLGPNRTLMVSGNETIGGAGLFNLTLNAGSTHAVTGGIMLGPTGTITQNAGSTLTYSTLTQAGGAFNGTLQNQGKFIYQSGQFNGQMVNGSGAYLVVAGAFSATNLVNNGDMVVINTSIAGPVVNNNAVTVVGSVDFNGPVSGPGDFFGPGTAHFNGGIAPGASPAHVAFEGNVVFGSTNTLIVELGGTTPGTQYDQIQVAGALNLGGTLQVSLIDAFAPTNGQSFDILDWGALSGTFATLQLPALNGSLAWNTSQLYTAGILSVGLSGDYNANGTVDAADYVVWRKTIGTQDAYNVWRTHLGQPPGSGAGIESGASASAAPEPSTLVMLIVAMWANVLSRRATVS